MKLKLAEEKDIDRVYNVLQDLINKKDKDLNWNSNYPNRDTIWQDINNSELFISEKEDTIIGAVVLNSTGEDVYDELIWNTETPAIYVHRFFVNPDLKGNGYGTKVIEQAFEYAKNNGFKSMRLDTFSGNTRAQRFYESKGFIKVGQVSLKGYEKCFYCYEKKM